MDKIKRAGDVIGTPAWQLDLMYGEETKWFLDKYFSSDDDFPASNVASDMSTADYHIGRAADFLCRAANLAERYGKDKPIDGLIDQLDELREEMRIIREALEGRQ